MIDIQYHNYTCHDVREWLCEGKSNGLSEQIISRVRADSLIHNPFVKDDDVIVVSATDNEKIVGFTAMFPEHLVRPDVWISNPTTLYADPKYAGEFIGYYVTQKLHETSRGRLVIGSDIAPATVLIDKLLGLQAETFNRRRFVMDRKIVVRSFRNFGSLILEPWRKKKQGKNIKNLVASINDDIKLEYTDFVDDESYKFMLSHCGGNMFVRTKEALNWLVKYPFRVESPLKGRLRKDCEFSSQCISFKTHLAKVFHRNEMVGFFMLAKRESDVHVMMLYYEDDMKEQVYASLLEQVLKMNPHQLWSLYLDFNGFVDSQKISLESYDESFVFTHPKELVMDKSLQLQGSDGDMFA